MFFFISLTFIFHVYFADGNSTLDIANGIIFHSPYCKLVQKSFARLLLNDFLRDKNPDFQGRYSGLEALRYSLLLIRLCLQRQKNAARYSKRATIDFNYHIQFYLKFPSFFLLWKNKPFRFPAC